MGLGHFGCCCGEVPPCLDECQQCSSYDPAETDWSEFFPGPIFEPDWYVKENQAHGDITWSIVGGRARSAPTFVGSQDCGWLGHATAFDCTDHQWMLASCNVYWSGTGVGSITSNAAFVLGSGLIQFRTGVFNKTHSIIYESGPSGNGGTYVVSTNAQSGDKLTWVCERIHNYNTGSIIDFFFNLSVYVNDELVYDEATSECYSGLRLRTGAGTGSLSAYTGSPDLFGPQLCRAYIGTNGSMNSGANYIEIDNVYWKSSATQPPLP